MAVLNSLQGGTLRYNVVETTGKGVMQVSLLDYFIITYAHHNTLTGQPTAQCQMSYPLTHDNQLVQVQGAQHVWDVTEPTQPGSMQLKDGDNGTVSFTPGSHETPRQYASFIGVAPFDHTSGTSVNGRTRVSQFCRKQQKVSITMAARSAIVNDPWMKNYYHRKMKEKGEQRNQHGVVLNAVKFKLVLRMFSVVKSGTPYKVMKY